MLKHGLLGTRLASHAKREKLYFRINNFKAQGESLFLLLKNLITKKFTTVKKESKLVRKFLAATKTRVGLKLFILTGFLTVITFGGSFGFNLGGRVSAIGGQIKPKVQGVAFSEVTVKELPFEVGKPLDTGEKSQGFFRYHPGIDIAAPYNTPIKTIGEGVVEEAGYRYDGLGKTVIIFHKEGFKSIYAHMNKIEVKKGEEVSDGKIIGTVGLTGRTTGAHLHLEIYENDKAVNPENLLPENYTTLVAL